MGARTFKQLVKEKSLEELNRFAKEVTEMYSQSVEEYSQKSAAMDNNLTPQGLRDVMDYAISTALVSLEVATKVLNKALRNQQRKKQEAGSTSIIHHRKIIKQRNELLAFSYSRLEIEKIANDIANDFSKTISHFTRKYDIESDGVTKLILQRSIVENIVTDEVVEKIIKRSKGNKNNPRADRYFDYLKQQRKLNKQEKNSQ